MNYADMTDFEINKAVAEARGGYGGVGYDPTGEGNVVNAFDTEFGAALYTERDYCNDPADAWPIIVEHRIGIQHFNNGTWQAHCPYDAVSHNENPLRAAMIVYLMMKEE